jgi:hypothetical protein
MSLRGSKDYLKTLHVECAGDMLELQSIRNIIKMINKKAKQSSNGNPYTRNIVRVKPRGARTKHAIADGRHPRAYDQSLPIRHAERLDVYIAQESNRDTRRFDVNV